MKKYTILLMCFVVILFSLKMNSTLSACSSDLVIQIPKTITLSLDKTSQAYTYTTVISAKGVVNSLQSLEISVPNECSFLNNSDKVSGSIDFGKDNKQVWTSTQLYKSITQLDNRIFSINVPLNTVKYIGTYSSIITFSITLKTSTDTDYDKIFTYKDDTITGLTTYGRSLSSIVVPCSINGQSITKIAENAFLNSGATKNIVISEGITSLANRSFYNCSSLTSITLPTSLNFMGDEVFSYCQVLSSIVVPNGVTSIGNKAFYNCSMLNTVSLPTTIIWIGSNAFSYCCNLSSINIPDGTISIGSTAFQYCSILYSITLPYSVTWIGDNAFSTCYNLNEIVFLNRTSTSDIILGSNWKLSYTKIVYK